MDGPISEIHRGELAQRIARFYKEEGGSVIERLQSTGHEIEVVPREGGAVNGIFRDPKTGVSIGGADPRGQSYAMGY